MKWTLKTYAICIAAILSVASAAGATVNLEENGGLNAGPGWGHFTSAGVRSQQLHIAMCIPHFPNSALTVTEYGHGDSVIELAAESSTAGGSSRPNFGDTCAGAIGTPPGFSDLVRREVGGISTPTDLHLLSLRLT